MDPYLERRGLWEEIQIGLIVAIQQFLTPLVQPHYRVAIERRTYLALLTPDPFAGKPDVLLISSASGRTAAGPALVAAGGGPIIGELPLPEEVIEPYLEIRDVVTGDVVTVIEILSLTNKLAGEGRTHYERKRLRVLGSETHLVEIDLLRGGEPLPIRLPDPNLSGDYSIIVSRAQQRPAADVYVFSLRDPMPDFPIPLRPHEAEPILPLNQLLHDLYERSGYDLAVDYRQQPELPLIGEDKVHVISTEGRNPSELTLTQDFFGKKVNGSSS